MSLADKLLKFFSGFNGTEPMDVVKRRAESNRKATIFLALKYKTPGWPKEIHHYATIPYSDEALANIQNKLGNGETPADFVLQEMKPGWNYITFYHVLSRDGKYFMHAMREGGSLISLESPLFTIELKQKLSTDHLPKDARFL